MDNLFGLSKEQIDFIKKILFTYIPNVKAYVFGSRARGNYKRYSDLDVVLDSHSPISIKTWLEIQEQFSESSLPIKVDLIEMNKLDPSFKAKIQDELQELL